MDFKTLVPRLTFKLHKGSCGRIGIVGGSKEYTGAPYFAAMSGLRTGCDLAYVFTHPEAAPILKSYSPELIVYPFLQENFLAENILQGNQETRENQGTRENQETHVLEEMNQVMKRLHALVIGPGLSKRPWLAHFISLFINSAKEYKIPIIIDADGIDFICKAPHLVHGYRLAVLTPNLREFENMCNAFVYFHVIYIRIFH